MTWVHDLGSWPVVYTSVEVVLHDTYRCDMQWHMQWHMLSTLFCPGKSYTVCYDMCNDMCRWHVLMIHSHDTSSWRIWWHIHWWHMLMTYLLSKKGYVIVFGPICRHGVELKQYVIAYVIGGGCHQCMSLYVSLHMSFRVMVCYVSP